MAKRIIGSTPKRDGYRMPAEFEPQSGILENCNCCNTYCPPTFKFDRIEVLAYKSNAHLFLYEVFREPLYGNVLGQFGLYGFMYHKHSPISFILFPAIAQSAML